ncbi:MAG: MBL fold metallo-hydrolase [bacterium]|nr:MBL fold metallo-hydrolase [bacterium]
MGQRLRLEQHATGGDRNFGYLVVHDGAALILDPGHDPSRLLEALAASEATLRWVVGSHGHEDHVASLDDLHRASGAARVLSRAAGRVAERLLGSEEEELPLGGLALSLLPTPGHTPCSLCLLLPALDGPPQLLTGDTLFVGKVGGSIDEAAARREFASLRGLLERCPEETGVWPGHDYGVRPSSTMGGERRENPFLLRSRFEDFLWLKENWLDYKKRHGIR